MYNSNGDQVCHPLTHSMALHARLPHRGSSNNLVLAVNVLIECTWRSHVRLNEALPPLTLTLAKVVIPTWI